MKYFSLSLISLLLSCAAPKGIVVPETIVTERLVPVPIGPDSALLRALFECDSTNRVVMRGLSEQKSPGMGTSLSFDPSTGVLDYRADKGRDTLYVPVGDTIRYVPRDVPGPQVNYLTGWQWFFVRIGQMACVILLLLLLYAAIKLFKR